MIRIPKRFYDDHRERDLDSPVIVKETKTHYWIKKHDEALPELIADARYYDNNDGGWTPESAGIRRAAGALLRVIADSGWFEANEGHKL